MLTDPFIFYWQIFELFARFSSEFTHNSTDDFTFLKYLDILSPCSHGLTQPFAVLQSNIRLLLLLTAVIMAPYEEFA